MFPRFYEVSPARFYPAVDGPRAYVTCPGSLLSADELNPLAACRTFGIKASPDPPSQNDFLNVDSDFSNLLGAHLPSCRSARQVTGSLPPALFSAKLGAN